MVSLKFLADLWNKIKRDSSALTVDISEDDIVILYVEKSSRSPSVPDGELFNSVVGPTGSGKSWFAREATRSDVVKVSKHQHPFTGKLQAIRCELTEEARRDPALEGVKNIVFVDTPSFLTGYDLPDALGEFERWFDRITYNPRHVSIIYMHRIETDPALEPIADHLRELSKVLLKTHLPQELLVVKSYDSESATIAEDRITQRAADLREQVEVLRHSTGKWKLSMHQEYFRGKPEEAWRAVEVLLRTDDEHL